jgi:hypothetical protein
LLAACANNPAPPVPEEEPVTQATFTPDPGCRAVDDTFLAALGEQLEPGSTLAAVRAVHDADYQFLWFVSAEIEDAPEAGDIATWAVRVDPTAFDQAAWDESRAREDVLRSTVYAANPVAEEISSWQSGRAVSPAYTTESPAAERSQDCILAIMRAEGRWE